MMPDRRRALGAIGGTAAAVRATRPAEALFVPRTTSILPQNRNTGAWLFQPPAGPNRSGVRYAGASTSRFSGRTASVGVLHRFQPVGGATLSSYVVPTLCGSSTVTPSREVIAFAGGSLTFNGAPRIPSGRLLDPDNRGLTMTRARQSVRMALSMPSSADTSWSLRTLDVQRVVQPVDTAFAMAAEGTTYGMATGATLAQVYDADASSGRAPRLRVDTQLATLRGDVYGPVSTSCGGIVRVDDRTTGVAHFVQLGSMGSPTGARTRVVAQAAQGRAHVVPFRYGWFFERPGPGAARRSRRSGRPTSPPARACATAVSGRTERCRNAPTPLVSPEFLERPP